MCERPGAMRSGDNRKKCPMIRRLSLILFFFIASFTIASERILVDQEITVIRGDFKEVHFLIPAGSGERLFLEGKFTAKGGYYDDLTFYILTQQEYVRWYSHRQYEALYKVEKKKEQSFKVEAKQGETYYFVMDNFFSTVSNKKVKILIKLVSEEAESTN